MKVTHRRVESRRKFAIFEYALTKMVKLGMRATQFLPLLLSGALFFGACAKSESNAAREAEINRRVQERLVAEHQAEEKQRLAQRETALMAREKALADRESSYGAMSATLSQAAPAPAEATTETGDDGQAYDDAATNPGVNGVVYPEQYGYPSYDEPDLDDPYLLGPSFPLVTIVNPNPRYVFINRRPFRGGHNGYQPGFGNGLGRGTSFPSRPVARAPMPIVSRRPSLSGSSRPIMTQTHPVARRTLTYTR